MCVERFGPFVRRSLVDFACEFRAQCVDDYRGNFILSFNQVFGVAAAVPGRGSLKVQPVCAVAERDSGPP